MLAILEELTKTIEEQDIANLMSWYENKSTLLSMNSS